MLEVKNISKTYKTGDLKQVALDDVSLCFRDNEFVSILGPSGSGKTTLLNIIGTLDSDFEGELSIMNNVINRDCTDEFLSNLRLKSIGIVFQSFNLISTMTTKENVLLPMIINDKLTKKEKENRAKNLLKRVGLEDRMEHLPSIF